MLLCSDCSFVACTGPRKIPFTSRHFQPRCRHSRKTKVVPDFTKQCKDVTIIGTRYPELDNFQNDVIQFGNYLQAEQCTRGGFVPIFWDAPYSYINASTDIGEVVDWITNKFVVANKGDLAVLHNRNKMVNAFATTEWVSGSGGAIISRSVTSCAGMTAYLVLLAQTRVGFLSGGRGKSFHQLPPQEQAAQREEAYARATVALTRAQQICFIMGPLDMRWVGRSSDYHWLLEIWCLLQWARRPGRPSFLIRLKDEDVLDTPDDSAFLQSLRFSCARVSGVYPPLALAEAYITEEDSAPRVRRLHLIVVDLHRRRRMADRVLRLLVDIQVDRCADECWNTLPIPWKQNQEAYQLRYVFGYAMDGSDLPCYILWPTRTAEQSFWCIDAWKGDWVRLDKWLRWESNTSLMPFALTHKGPGEQPHAKLWAFPPAMFQKIPILNRCMRTSSRLLQGASRLNGRHLLLSVESIRTWLRERRVYRMRRVDGQGCRTTPPRTRNVLMLRPHQ